MFSCLMITFKSRYLSKQIFKKKLQSAFFYKIAFVIQNKNSTFAFAFEKGVFCTL